jgi:hypothetical protein
MGSGMKRPEQALHTAVAHFLDAALAPGVFWTSLDHAGGGATVGAFRKARGVRKGLPDIMLLFGGRVFFIELKSEAGRLSPAQKEFSAILVRQCIAHDVARSLNEVIGLLGKWKIPTIGRIAA